MSAHHNLVVHLLPRVRLFAD